MKSSLCTKVILLLCLSLTFLAGCASTGNGGQFNAIVAEDTPLNESGPRQTTPAEVLLRKGDRVRVVNGGEYPYVETVDGKRGFIHRSMLQKYDN